MKNVLLIMSTNGYLVPPSQNPEREELWNETWKRIDRFLPDLKNSLALEPLTREDPPRKSTASKEGESAPAAAAVPEGQAQGEAQEKGKADEAPQEQKEQPQQGAAEEKGKA